MGRLSAQKEEIRLNFVSPEYFPVLHIPLVQGRMWDGAEVGRGARLAIINESMARRYWSPGDAIGHAVRMPQLKARPPFMEAVPESDQWMQIIGVVADARDDGLRKPVMPAVYVPYKTMMGMWTQLLVRTHGSPLAILNQVRTAVKSVDPDQQVVRNTRDLDQWIEREDEYAYGRLSAALLTSISVVALLLAAIGLFSVVSYGVAQRTNELGIRMALGASKLQVLKLVLQGTATYVLAGLACGSVMSFLLRGAVSKWAEGSTYSITALGGVTLLLILTATLATVIPARRASSIEPMEALRYD